MIGLLGIIGATMALLRMICGWVSLSMSCARVCLQYCSEFAGCIGIGGQCISETCRVSIYYFVEFFYQVLEIFC